MAYRCTTCGELHNDLPDIGSDRPDQWWGIPEEQREERIKLTSDTCIIDDDYFIRGVIEIPILNSSERFGFGVWISQKKENFETYLNARTRLAISKEEEQQIQLNAVRAKALSGSGGTEEKAAQADVKVDAEIRKQAELDTMYQKGILSREAYNEAILASDQRAAQAELEFDLANQAARAELLGESEAGYALKQDIAEERFQLELQQKIDRAQLEMETDEEIQAMRVEMQAVHDQQQLEMQDAHLNALASREDLSGATITATRQKWFREQEKHANENIKKILSGYMILQAGQEAYNTTTQKLGDALVKNEKITASKFVGIFLEQLGRKIQMDGFANILLGAAMSVLLNPQGPALIAAGGAEVAGGTAIARLGTSMQGGQGDEGIDDVPQPLSGKSFVVSGGERIVQPSANRDLKDFLNKEKTGGGGGTNVTMNISFAAGTGSDMARETVDALIEELRRRSELGTTIISAKGIGA